MRQFFWFLVVINRLVKIKQSLGVINTVVKIKLFFLVINMLVKMKQFLVVINTCTESRSDGAQYGIYFLPTSSL